ncbi:MAG TPA: nickel-binding protein [Rhizobacter sp.]|nr:nickel-binding protein [Rhizobacter sp.]
MHTYLVRRAGIAADAAELDAALMRLRSFEETPHALHAQWLHSYVLLEPDGRFGLACVFQAEGAATLVEHARRCRLPAREILPVAGQEIVRAFAPALVHLVRRRKAWASTADLERAYASSRRVGDEDMVRQVSWLRSYAVREDDGSLGSVCLYQAIDPAALGEHAQRAGVPADEIRPVMGRIVFLEPQRGQPAAPKVAPA